MSEINLIQGEATVINVTNASEPTIISMGVLEVVKIDEDFLAYIGMAEAARDESVAAQGLSEGARDTSVAAKDLSIAARDAALTAQGLSEGARDASIAAWGLSEGARDISVAAKDDAAIAQGLAETAQGLAETARGKAQDWADANEDVEVEAGAYSARHWSIKAEAWADVAADPITPHDTNADAHANLSPRVPAAHDHDTSYEPLLGVPGADDYLLSSATDGTRSWVPAPAGAQITISETAPPTPEVDDLWCDGDFIYIYEATP